MNQLFNPDNPLMRLLGKFFDLIILNLLFLLTSIPIFTIGASLSSLYHITLKIVNDDDPYIVKGYFKAFRSNFKQATLIWIPCLLACIFFAFDLYIIFNLIGPNYTFLQFPVLILLFIIFSIMIYAFPMLSGYQCTIKQIIKNSILLSIANIPVTVMIIAIHVAIAYIASMSAKNLITVISLLLFFGIAFIAYFISFFLLNIFNKCKLDTTE